MLKSLKKRLVHAMGSFIISTMGLFRKKKLFKLEYKHGFNIHFDTTLEKLSEAVPECFTPIPIRVMEGDQEPRYMVSMYLAETQLKGTQGSFGRGDIFTYVLDADNKSSLYFLGVIQQAPPFRGPPRKVYNMLLEYFRMDPLDHNSPAYPHKEARDISVGGDSFDVISTEGSSVVSMASGMKLNCGVFHRDFIVSNSRVYRGSKGTRNVTFFNQDFMDAKVTRWDVSNVVTGNSRAIHPACGDVVLAESYGDDESTLSWYIEVT